MYNNNILKYFCVLLFVITTNTMIAQGHVNCSPTIDTLLLTFGDSASLVLETYSFNDTLDVKCKTYGFLYPIILAQNAYFTINGSVVSKRVLDFLPFHKHNYRSSEIQIQTLPIFDIGIYKGKERFCYYLYGASFCNGTECPEYIGLYELDGTLLYEEIGILKYLYCEKYSSLDDFCNKNEIDINKPISMKSIYSMFFEH